MLEKEIRLRCIEAAAKAPIVHQDGPVTGVIEAAQSWFDWISRSEPLPPVAGVNTLL